MKKIVAVIILAVIGGLVVADLAKSDDNSIEPTHTTTTNRPTVTTSDDADERAFCIEKADQASELFSEYASLIPSIATMADARAALEAGRALVVMAEAWLDRCGTLFPARASSIRSNLNEFEDALDEIESLL